MPKAAGASGPTAQNERILTELSNDNLRAAVELNSAAFIRLQGLLPWVELHDEDDVLWVFAGDTWPRNSVARARFTAAIARDRVREILQRHLAEKVACNWAVGPISMPTDLNKHLSAVGFRCMIHCAGMACDLKKPRRGPALPKGLTVSHAQEVPLLQAMTTERRKRRYEGRNIIARSASDKARWFSACLNGRPVGETALCLSAGVAGLYDVEVLADYRKRGIGSCLVYAALEQAEALGYHAAVLGATGMGTGLYSRFGFREVCKLSYWKYGKMRQRAFL